MRVEHEKLLIALTNICLISTLPYYHMSAGNEYIPKFDFLEQIAKEDTYSALSTARVGLAIIKLYSKIKAGYYPKGRFKEKDIYYALEDISKLKGTPYDPIPQEHFNDLII